jgi:hypothetical protein
MQSNERNLVRVVVCCRQSDGAPTLALCETLATVDEVNEGVHYDKAACAAEEKGYGSVSGAFDMNDPAASMLDQLAAVARSHRAGKLALVILAMDGAYIQPSNKVNKDGNRAWTLTMKGGERSETVCATIEEAASAFAWHLYCEKAAWMKEVANGTCTESYAFWSEGRLRAVHATLRAKTEQSVISKQTQES